MNKIFCLMGPTSSGKSALALHLSEHLPFEIISVDSVMVYCGLDIGSAKPTKAIRAHIPHHLIDIRNPTNAYSAGQFYHDVWDAISAVQLRGKIPLLVGGTMLYFKVLFQGIAPLPSANEKLRNEIKIRAALKGWPALHQELRSIDQQAAERINNQDSQRIQRALEIYYLTGKPISVWQTQNLLAKKNIQFHPIALKLERDNLHEKIVERFKKMLEDGLVEEVHQLISHQDLTIELPALRAVGYREVLAYLTNQLTHDEMCQRVIISTRQLAKRQMTWLRSFENIHWFQCENPNQIESKLLLHLNRHIN